MTYETICPSEKDILNGLGEKNIPCPKPGCDKILAQSGALHMHLTKVHNIFQNDQSVKLFSGIRSAHRECRYHCPAASCKYNIKLGRFFKTELALKRHYQNLHTEKKFKCSRCGLAYLREVHQLRHTLSCKMTFMCSECMTQFNSKVDLYTHCVLTAHKYMFHDVPTTGDKREPVTSTPTRSNNISDEKMQSKVTAVTISDEKMQSKVTAMTISEEKMQSKVTAMTISDEKMQSNVTSVTYPTDTILLDGSAKNVNAAVPTVRLIPGRSAEGHISEGHISEGHSSEGHISQLSNIQNKTESTHNVISEESSIINTRHENTELTTQKDTARVVVFRNKEHNSDHESTQISQDSVYFPPSTESVTQQEFTNSATSKSDEVTMVTNDEVTMVTNVNNTEEISRSHSIHSSHDASLVQSALVPHFGNDAVDLIHPTNQPIILNSGGFIQNSNNKTLRSLAPKMPSPMFVVLPPSFGGNIVMNTSNYYIGPNAVEMPNYRPILPKSKKVIKPVRNKNKPISVAIGTASSRIQNTECNSGPDNEIQDGVIELHKSSATETIFSQNILKQQQTSTETQTAGDYILKKAMLSAKVPIVKESKSSQVSPRAKLKRTHRERNTSETQTVIPRHHRKRRRKSFIGCDSGVNTDSPGKGVNAVPTGKTRCHDVSVQEIQTEDESVLPLPSVEDLARIVESISTQTADSYLATSTHIQGMENMRDCEMQTRLHMDMTLDACSTMDMQSLQQLGIGMQQDMQTTVSSPLDATVQPSLQDIQTAGYSQTAISPMDCGARPSLQQLIIDMQQTATGSPLDQYSPMTAYDSPHYSNRSHHMAHPSRLSIDSQLSRRGMHHTYTANSPSSLRDIPTSLRDIPTSLRDIPRSRRRLAMPSEHSAATPTVVSSDTVAPTPAMSRRRVRTATVAKAPPTYEKAPPTCDKFSSIYEKAPPTYEEATSQTTQCKDPMFSPPNSELATLDSQSSTIALDQTSQNPDFTPLGVNSGVDASTDFDLPIFLSAEAQTVDFDSLYSTIQTQTDHDEELLSDVLTHMETQTTDDFWSGLGFSDTQTQTGDASFEGADLDDGVNAQTQTVTGNMQHSVEVQASIHHAENLANDVASTDIETQTLFDSLTNSHTQTSWNDLIQIVQDLN